MNPLTLEAPAKLNLSLRVLAKRDDGYHDIDTVMVKLPLLADRLHFAPAATFAFACDDPALPDDERNLVVKAVRAFEAAAKITCKCAISLQKAIPHGAGLGGGSSDAASTLLGLNRLHDEPLAPAQVAALAAALGSDVAFFLSPGAARCTGRGEHVVPVFKIPALPVLLLKPAFGIATADAYARWQDSSPLPGIRYDAQDTPCGTFVNDLERPVFGKHRFLAEVKSWLQDRKETVAALLAGSGSTVFAVLNHADDARLVADAARMVLDPGIWTWAGTTEGSSA
ncbi:MAG: 4-(cytidine 5'-diphospho)-2-C-methyl-D-erythritol kinase [Verrucomicrobia bacterium]|nr:4-(cytidine 5'-diphospho)-2-C-methyl-D-erythritol kinase [Verrucomicrobiota bacterium]